MHSTIQIAASGFLEVRYNLGDSYIKYLFQAHIKRNNFNVHIANDFLMNNTVALSLISKEAEDEVSF